MVWPKKPKEFRRDQFFGNGAERSDGHRERSSRSDQRFESHNVLNGGAIGEPQHYWRRSSTSPAQPREPRTPPGRPPSASPIMSRSPSPNHYYDFDYFMRMSDRIEDDFTDEHDRGLSISDHFCPQLTPTPLCLEILS